MSGVKDEAQEIQEALDFGGEFGKGLRDFANTVTELFGWEDAIDSTSELEQKQQDIILTNTALARGSLSLEKTVTENVEAITSEYVKLRRK